jgi:hypothetical protein
MQDPTIEKFHDVLQNIEYAIRCEYEVDSTLLDLDVIDALDALVRRYASEEQGRTPPKLHLTPRADRVYSMAARMCDWRLGRAPLNPCEPEEIISAAEANSLADILQCLKRIRKSARFWNEERGRQGYLDYISEFFTQMDRPLR